MHFHETPKLHTNISPPPYATEHHIMKLIAGFKGTLDGNLKLSKTDRLLLVNTIEASSARKGGCAPEKTFYKAPANNEMLWRHFYDAVAATVFSEQYEAPLPKTGNAARKGN